MVVSVHAATCPVLYLSTEVLNMPLSWYWILMKKLKGGKAFIPTATDEEEEREKLARSCLKN